MEEKDFLEILVLRKLLSDPYPEQVDAKRYVDDQYCRDRLHKLQNWYIEGLKQTK